MSAITPGVVAHDKLPSMASRFVNVESVPWQKSRYDGIETKTLLVDKSSGLLTMLMKMAPGAQLPDHEHVDIEQSWILSGSLDCGEGSCTAGNFVWRPAGSRHDAWAGPDGVLLLGMFQLPNRFFEQGGQQLDFLGQDWEKTWGQTHTRQQQAKFA
ncbi:MAG TPA: cupin domain-containing protein [Burkholderiales bacterium]|nr:cupin domain-containing protein [Burkholderiales bacterium]